MALGRVGADRVVDIRLVEFECRVVSDRSAEVVVALGRQETVAWASIVAFTGCHVIFLKKYIGPIFRFRFASRPFLSLLCVFVLCERKGKKRKERCWFLGL